MMNGNNHRRMKLKISSLIFIVLIQNADISAQKTVRFADFSKSIKTNKKIKEAPVIKLKRNCKKTYFNILWSKPNKTNDYF